MPSPPSCDGKAFLDNAAFHLPRLNKGPARPIDHAGRDDFIWAAHVLTRVCAPKLGTLGVESILHYDPAHR